MTARGRLGFHTANFLVSFFGIAMFNAMLADPTAKARFTELGASLLPGSSADFGKLIADETEKWGNIR